MGEQTHYPQLSANSTINSPHHHHPAPPPLLYLSPPAVPPALRIWLVSLRQYRTWVLCAVKSICMYSSGFLGTELPSPPVQSEPAGCKAGKRGNNYSTLDVDRPLDYLEATVLTHHFSDTFHKSTCWRAGKRVSIYFSILSFQNHIVSLQ